MQVLLPAEMETFRQQAEASLLPSVVVIPQANEQLSPWQSKIGGIPYLPKDHPYPLDKDGNIMELLAQINFEELAKVSELPHFPKKGLLQFFIGNDLNFGLDKQDLYSQKGFRLVYFPEVIKEEGALQTNFHFLQRIDEQLSPLAQGTQNELLFELKNEVVPTSDIRFKSFYKEEPFDFFANQFGDKEDDVWDAYEDMHFSSGHKMGGYAYFSQEDPRADDSTEILLLQVTSDFQNGIMWKNGGTCNFFIQPEALEKADFSEVLYNWGRED